MGTGTEAGRDEGASRRPDGGAVDGHGSGRPVGRRRALAIGLAGVAASVAGCSSVPELLGPTRYDAVQVEVRAPTVVWSGEVAFRSTDGTRVQIPVNRALGSRTYVLPDDIDADAYDVIAEPISVVATPERGVTEDDPLVVVVSCDGESCGRAVTTTVGESVTVTVN